jgi:superfamily II DNA or RNA helicase
MNVGSLVRYRERDWVVLPSDDPNLMMLRPIGGSGREVCGVYIPLANLLGFTFDYEHITTSQFPLPNPSGAQDHVAVRLLLDASRLLLREGAAPFRSLGHVSVRPRPYQFVPLLMALKLDTVRLLIADDVGVGKTIEAGLIARELLDRGDIRRIAVLCPPYLCDQWQKELSEKFHIEAVVLRSGTVSRLERQTPPDRSLFQYFPYLVVSIDLAKSERYRPAFLQYCPELVIVDEVHGAAQPRGQAGSSSQQQRHELLKGLSHQSDRHLILLTATPHSGVEESFRSILGLLKAKFQSWDLARLSEKERIELARHFVQRRRVDVVRWPGPNTRFPERVKDERPYQFSPDFRRFYDDVYEFASGLVKSAETLKGWKRRMRFWSALALLRCVASSPAAAETALLKRTKGEDESLLTFDQEEALTAESLDAAFEPVVYDPLEAESSEDAAPSNVFNQQEQDNEFGSTDRRRLRDFARRAGALRGDGDPKLAKLVQLAQELLRDGYNPIIWCRYIATADYVAEALTTRLAHFADIKIASVTGALSDEERRLKVGELTAAKRRVLVATDCLSEGINLQDHFNAIVHYDLPWNPNRLEQREGRVDRFGQTAEKVKAVLIFGQDNPVDGAVLDVLLRKANEIYKRLGVHVPVPVESEGVMEAVLRSLFARAREATAPPGQLKLFDLDPEATRTVEQLHREMERVGDREKESRTRFAQHAIKPEEVERELDDTDRVLGTPDDVRRFLLEASQRLTFSFTPRRNGIWDLDTTHLPPSVRQSLGNVPDRWPIMFDSPTLEEVNFVGRNHVLVEALAEYLFDLAFHPPTNAASPAARVGVIRTADVFRRTTLLLLRVRYLVYERRDEQPSLAEETLVWGCEGLLTDTIAPLAADKAKQLMDNAQAKGNVPDGEKHEVLRETLAEWSKLDAILKRELEERTKQLIQAHKRVREMLDQSRRLRIEPQLPPDLLGVLVLLPVPKG